MVFNRAGDRLAVYAWDGVVRLYEADTGQLLFQASSVCGKVLRLHFDADGRRLAGLVRGSRLGIWQVGAGQERCTLHLGPSREGCSKPAVSPDSRLLAAVTNSGVALWDLDAGTEVAWVPLENAAWFVAFEPEAGGALLLGDESGLYRLPLRTDPLVPGRLRIGPPSRWASRVGTALGGTARGRC
jgi:hypothetical protein